jgi:peptidoglycan hydrolase CwlO-like protein
MDIEKTIEFILSTQARVEVSIEELKTVARAHEERVARLESSMATATDLIGRLAQAETRLAERMESGFRELREAQATGLKELRESQTATDYKLNALIETVDKIVRKNGRGRKRS